MTDLALSPLNTRHAALGARFAPFSGWSMPLEYAGGGVVTEHTAVRTDVGVFDVSHLGTLAVRGRGAADLIERVSTNDLSRIATGQAQYTLLCNSSGGVIDDLIAYLRSDDDLLLIPNAANAGQVADVLRANAPAGIEIADLHTQMAILAVQGPRSAEVLDALGLISDLPYMSFVDTKFAGADVVVCRTGYTGEHGYELVIPADAAGPLWDAVVAAGARPCGLGARDTLRTEMGYPLHGNELSPTITPVEAGAGWAVGWDKPQFIGRDALRAQRAEGTGRRARGLVATVRAIPRPGMAVTSDEGVAGVVTSGTFSPTLRQGIALALFDRPVEVGSVAEVDVRGRPVPFEIVRPPFIDRTTR